MEPMLADAGDPGKRLVARVGPTGPDDGRRRSADLAAVRAILRGMVPSATAVLFVCAGNICRSPMADAVFQHLVVARGLGDRFMVDSAGTGAWHVGNPPHPETLTQLELHGIDGSGLRARQVTAHDLELFDYVLAMDDENLAHLRWMSGTPHAEVGLLLDFTDEVDVREVPDPYYAGGYERVYQLVHAGCTGLLHCIRDREGI